MTTEKVKSNNFINLILVGTSVAMIVLVLKTHRALQQPEDPVKKQAALRDLNALKQAAIAYARDNKKLPVSLDALAPRYIRTVPRDPYGRFYKLKSGGGSQIYIWYLGADGELRRYPPDICAIVDLNDVS